jgi:hypothetical protein
MNKEQNMINIVVGSPTPPRAYVRVDEITNRDENFRMINAIKAVRSIALMDRDSRSAVCSPAQLLPLIGLKEAKDFVESFVANLANAADIGKPMIVTSDTMSQENLELLVSVIMFHSNCRYSIHIKP